jgi:diadenosine tetraphosphate (Ap4A) HIT family hydrolase
LSAGGCVFCEILSDRAPASIVHREGRACAFMDIRPVNPGYSPMILIMIRFERRPSNSP